MAATSIQWTDHSINPIRFGGGHYCQKISPGCALCYASRLQPRFGNPEFGGASSAVPKAVEAVRDDNDDQLWLDESKLQEVLKRRKPTKWFWCDMTDIFGSWVPDEWIDRCLAVMALTPQHTHQVLTKRPERMLKYMDKWGRRDVTIDAAAGILSGASSAPPDHPSHHRWDAASDVIYSGKPLPNVWLGFSAENQEWFDRRAPHAVELARQGWLIFVSAEPLLGPIEFSDATKRSDAVKQLGKKSLDGIHWVIVGGESGPGARPCNVEWIRSLVKQCKAADVPVFVKQVGSQPFEERKEKGWHQVLPGGGKMKVGELEMRRDWSLRDKKGGDIEEWPEDLRVRQFPEVPPCPSPT